MTVTHRADTRAHHLAGELAPTIDECAAQLVATLDREGVLHWHALATGWRRMVQQRPLDDEPDGVTPTPRDRAHVEERTELLHAAGAAARALALLATRPAAQFHARDELTGWDLHEPGELRLLRAVVREAQRRWPTPPALPRGTELDPVRSDPSATGAGELVTLVTTLLLAGLLRRAPLALAGHDARQPLSDALPPASLAFQRR